MVLKSPATIVKRGVMRPRVGRRQARRCAAAASGVIRRRSSREDLDLSWEKTDRADVLKADAGL